jgi:hypothetical protein
MDILMPASADLCPSCRSSMLADQRYCLECGERRSGRPPAASAAPVAGPPVRARRGSFAGAPAGATLVAGVATLLLALGVGVEIGRSGRSVTPAAAPVRVVTVGGTAAPAAGAGTAAPGAVVATPTPSATTDASSSGKATSKAKATPTPKPKAAKTPPPDVKVGSPGKGPGYKDGKFTGDFFGG